MRKCRKFVLQKFKISVKNALASSWLLTKQAKGTPKLRQRISREARKPRVLKETLYCIRKTKGSQGKAKGETKDLNGSQEAKDFEGNIYFYSKKKILQKYKERMGKCRKSRMPWPQVGF